jgi:hypothetical protein
LSRCLQFHLKALDVEQIRHQLEHILNEEHIAHEPRALQLLARAAEGRSSTRTCPGSDACPCDPCKAWRSCCSCNREARHFPTS